MDNKKRNDKKDVITSWVVVALLLLIPLGLTLIIYKVIMVVLPTLVFTASNLVKLYAVVSILMIAAMMIITTRKK